MNTPQEFKLIISQTAQPALGAALDDVVIKIRKNKNNNNKTETPIVVSAAADALPQASVDQTQGNGLETTGHASPAARGFGVPREQDARSRDGGSGAHETHGQVRRRDRPPEAYEEG